MKITMRQYAHLAWLFESPFPRYFNKYGRSSNSMRKVQDNLVEKGLVKIVKCDNEIYKSCLEDYKNGETTKEDLQEWKEYCFQNLDKVWWNRKWMTHKEIVLDKHFIISLPSYHTKDDCSYPSLTEEGVVAVLRKFGLRSDSKLKVSAQPKWRVEWVETN